LSNATQITNPNVTLPTDYSNRSIAFANATSSYAGGVNMLQGFYRGLVGNVTAFATPTPITMSAATFNMGTSADNQLSTSFIANFAGTVTMILRPANETSITGSNAFTGVTSTNTGRWLYIKTVTANTVVSGSSDVVPIDGTAAGTAILPATAGAWAALQSDGTNWVIMARGT
jgi:hypothetical protein